MAGKLILCTIVSAGVLFGFSLLVLYLVTITNKVKFHVAGADLTQFNFTDDGQFQYDLSLNITVKNPNLRAGIYFDAIEVTLSYEDIEIETLLLTPFYQGRKGKSLLVIQFEGQKPMNLEREKLEKFNLEKVVGVFSIDVELRLHLRVKFGLLKIFKVKPKVGCGFMVPLISRGTSFLRFQITGCHVHY